MRVLCLAPVPPSREAAHGGGRAIAELLVRLAERHEIALLCLRSPEDGPVDPLLRERCAMVHEVPREPARGRLGSLVRRVRVVGAMMRGTPAWVAGSHSQALAVLVRDVAARWRPEIVHLEYHLMGGYLSALDGCRAPRVLRQLEPGATTAMHRARYRGGLARLAAPLDAWAWRRFEHLVMSRVSVVVALTERDAAALRPRAGRTPIAQIPLGVTPPAEAYDAAGGEPAELLFVGNFSHPPNIEALERLARVILPGIRSRHPGAILRAVGEGPPAALRGSEAQGLVLTGRVADVQPFLDRAAVVVAPLRLGGGMRVKVMEALAAGKAVVASPLAVEGLDVADGEQLRIADTDDQMIEATVELLRNSDLRVRLATRARAWAIRTLSWDGPAAAFDRLYRSLAPDPVDGSQVAG